MAKTQSSTKTASKSDVIREILKKRPHATAKEIQAALQEQGVEASDALVSKIKYGRKRKGAGGKKPSGRRRANARGNKAEAIRGMWRELGADARPRDVIATLASRGVTVSFAQVSKLRRANGKSRKSAVVSLDHLLAAKRFSEQIGGVEVARQIIESLAKVMAD